MPNTYSQIYVQIVFAVEGRQHFIAESFRERVQQYITGIVQNKGQKLLSIFCMPDHIHILVSIKPNISVSDLVRDVKSNSTAFIKENGINGFSWQKGFGAFSYAKSQMHEVVQYISNQPAHHHKKSFKEEYIAFLNKFEIEFDDKYLFQFY
jgi:putative transposase